MIPGMKTCPYCAEHIKAEAVKCRYCQSSLVAPAPGHAVVQHQQMPQQSMQLQPAPQQSMQLQQAPPVPQIRADYVPVVQRPPERGILAKLVIGIFKIVFFPITILAALAESSGITRHGKLNPKLVCKQCETRGGVRTRETNRKRGISGGKATAAIFTGGLSLIATGLSRKENVTAAHCDNCGSDWDF